MDFGISFCQKDGDKVTAGALRFVIFVRTEHDAHGRGRPTKSSDREARVRGGPTKGHVAVIGSLLSGSGNVD